MDVHVRLYKRQNKLIRCQNGVKLGDPKECHFHTFNASIDRLFVDISGPDG